MGGNATNVQMVTGEIVQAGLNAILRNTHPPESYNLCAACAAPVYEFLHQAPAALSLSRIASNSA